MNRWLTPLCAAVLLCANRPILAQGPVTTAFTFQGELHQSGNPATGLYDLRFRLYDAQSGGAQIGSTQCANNVSLSTGRFTIQLDFGAQFAGQQRYLEIDVRADTGLDCTNGAGYTTLAPRQPLSAAPNAMYALNATAATSAATATTANNAAQLNGQEPAFYQNAANLSGGTIPDARLAGAYTGALALSNTANVFAGSGEGLTALNASNITFGTLDVARLPAPFGLSGATTCIISGMNTSNADQSAGVCGVSTATTGISYGVYGQNSSIWGTGVYGEATSANGVSIGVQGVTASDIGRGVLGISNNPTGPGLGVYGISYGDSGTGLYGWAINSTGTGRGVQGVSSSPNGNGVYGVALSTNGPAVGGMFRSDSTTGLGVYGFVTATTGTNFGVYGQTPSTDGRGVYGWATAASGTTYGVFGQSDATFGRGVYGLATNASGPNYGVYGEASGSFGSAVYGEHTATTGTTYGGRFQTRSTDGRAVRGYATATSGITYGGNFRSDSNTGYGVYGSADGGTGLGAAYGVYGETGNRSGVGVYGRAWESTTSNNYGMMGESRGTAGRGAMGWATATTGTTYGVYGQSDSTAATAYGVWAQGRLGASGTKSFRIDHPADPENKYLLHYSAESPDVLNLYSGNITLDGDGRATVELPAYFASISKDPRYTLTPIGAPMPMLHIAQKIPAADLVTGAATAPGERIPVVSFVIAGGAPGQEVSWEVKAVRNDRWVQQHGAPVEVDKEGLERGTYQHPELYGQPEDKGMNWSAHERTQANPTSGDQP